MRQRNELEHWITIFEVDLAAALLRANAVCESMLNRPTPEPGDDRGVELADYEATAALHEEAVRRVETLRTKLTDLRMQLSQCSSVK